MILCTPTWGTPRTGSVLIVGSASCVYEDVKSAQALGPAAMFLINGAALLFEHAEHWLIGHGEKAPQFRRAREQVFVTPIPFIHASQRGGTNPSGVTHIWQGVSTGGTSAWKGVRIAKAMGYERVILCGCPIDDSGYADGESRHISHGCARIGLGEGRMYNNYRRTFAVRAKDEGENVFSMSGYSRELLGAPV